MEKKYKLGIFLEAGGNAVFFSNGVLKALEKQNIKADYIMGYSSSAAIMFGHILNCHDFILEEFGQKLKKNKKNFYFFRRNHFPHDEIYKSSVENMLSAFGRNSLCYNTDFTIIAAKTAKKFARTKALAASFILLFYKAGIDMRKYFNKFFKIELFDAGSELKNKLGSLLDIIVGSSCLYPFIKLYFYDNHLILEGGLVNPGYKKYLENCEKGIVVHTDFGKTAVRNGILHIYSSREIPLNVLDYTDGSKLEIMQKAGEDEVCSNLGMFESFLKPA